MTSASRGAPPIIYNLFPTLVGPVSGWVGHAVHARAMGFNWLYVNPVTYPGFSGSLYAVKEHAQLHPELVPPGAGSDLDVLAPVIAAIRELGVEVMLDLVVNHTSRDCPLVTAHPDWFRRDAAGRVVSPSVVDPGDPELETVWGDLAEVDNAGSPDREALWRFWLGLVDRTMDLGVTGFRCDAAYKVPAALWRRLISHAKDRVPESLFVAETLGCQPEEVEALADAGFDYVYNSSKWWDGLAPWALDQHERFRRVAPSISFPESHDTPRLAAETGGNEAVQGQRYALAAVFSAGVQLPVGYEFGFRRALDVVKTRPGDWETPAFDLTGFVRHVNRLKATHPLFETEGVLRALDWDTADITVLRRWSGEGGRHRGVILLNRSATGDREVRVDRRELAPGARLLRLDRDDDHAGVEPVPDVVRLSPAELALLAAPHPD
jgi:starch synthase (maltosyl-transferring)